MIGEDGFRGGSGGEQAHDMAETAVVDAVGVEAPEFRVLTPDPVEAVG